MKMKVDINLLKQLRDMTMAPLGDCKDALIQWEWDLELAAKVLKEKGILKAGKKAGRETNEWLVKFVSNDGWTAGVKLLCETDFVAKNDSFHQFVDGLLTKILNTKNSIKNLDAMDGALLDEMKVDVAEFVGKIGENVQLGDVLLTDMSVFAYNHPGNKVATLVYFDGDNTGDVAKEVALQVAAMDPAYLSVDKVDEDYKKELEVQFHKEMEWSNKPENVVEQILEGKMNKALWEVVLLEQSYIRDGSKKIKDILPEWFTVTDYVRYSI